MIIEDWGIPIILSIISAIIFWIFFDCIPYRRKHNKIRPIIEYDIYEIKVHCLFYLETAFRSIPYSPSKQNELNAGTISKDDFNIWLHNKCLNESYLFDENKEKFIIVGANLKKNANILKEKIESTLIFTEFLTANEIVLLKKLKYKLFVYEYDTCAMMKMENQVFHPVIPNISYMATNFFEIYQLFLELQNLILKYKKIRRGFNLDLVPDLKGQKIANLYYSNDYQKCLNLINKDEKYFTFKFMCLHKLNRLHESYNVLRVV